MNNNQFYNIKNISFPDRESFNNTIILLTMVKSEYYYIVGFSRERGCIKIAFDFDSDIHNKITEFVNIDFISSNDSIIIESEISNISDKILCENRKENIEYSNGKYIYKKIIKKDDVFPIGSHQMHDEILSAKNEITDYLESYYKKIIT